VAHIPARVGGNKAKANNIQAQLPDIGTSTKALTSQLMAQPSSYSRTE